MLTVTTLGDYEEVRVDDDRIPWKQEESYITLHTHDCFADSSVAST